MILMATDMKVDHFLRNINKKVVESLFNLILDEKGEDLEVIEIEDGLNLSEYDKEV